MLCLKLKDITGLLGCALLLLIFRLPVLRALRYMKYDGSGDTAGIAQRLAAIAAAWKQALTPAVSPHERDIGINKLPPALGVGSSRGRPNSAISPVRCLRRRGRLKVSSLMSNCSNDPSTAGTYSSKFHDLSDIIFGSST